MNTKMPNIIFILSDDQGMWSMGCAGNKEIITPNLDRLASEGMLFDNFFCASPVCSPARASLLTGRIPSQHGVHDWLRNDNKKQEDIEYLRGMKAYTDVLAENGYICGLSGKWHLGNSAKPQKSYSHWFAHKSGGGPYYNAPLYKDGVLYNEPRYVTDVITDDALEFIDENAGKQPFYLTACYTAPHSPWVNNHPKEYTDLYKDCPFDSIPKEKEHPDSIYLTKEVAKDLRSNLIGYFAAVTAMDANIGRIIDKVESLGIREDTLIVFTSDNGFSCGHHGFWGKGNGTFPINMYDSSVKVPFIASQPGTIPENKVCDALVSAYDFMPTLLNYVGIEDYEDENLPGKSFAAALKGLDFEQDDKIIVLDEYGPNRMIRNKEFKYIKRYPYGPDEMYDLINDPDEKNNLLLKDSHDELAAELRYELEAWFSKYVNPEIDGAKEAVYGSGQINLAGLWSKGEVSHSCDDYIKESPNYKPYSLK